MPRLLFEKTGNAVWISHLDLMRLFQRAFKRAGLPLKHSQGYNPRPYVAVALPLSVGTESVCELLDFDLEAGDFTPEQIRDGLNRALVHGIRVREVYEDGRKIRDLALLDCVVILEYDGGVPSGAMDAVEALFHQETLTVEKKGKNGPTDQDIIPMIRSLTVTGNGHTLALNARVCCQNPSLNPMQLGAAVRRYLPELAPDYIRCRRLALYDTTEKPFR